MPELSRFYGIVIKMLFQRTLAMASSRLCFDLSAYFLL